MVSRWSPREITIGAQLSTGAFRALSVLPHFNAGVTLRTQHGDLPLGPIQDWILADVNAQLIASIQEIDLGAAIVQALESARSRLG